MTIKTTYEYIFSEDELRQVIVDYFNKSHTGNIPITKSNVKLETNKMPYCEPTVSAVITIDEVGNEN